MASVDLVVRNLVVSTIAELLDGLRLLSEGGDVLAEVSLHDPAFDAPENGRVIAIGDDGENPTSAENPLTATGTADAGAGTVATAYQLLEGSDVRLSGAVGVAGSSAEVQLSSTTIAEGQTVNLTMVRISMPES